jgi:asparagine synthase (glutamine-hydrolysing)
MCGIAGYYNSDGGVNKEIIKKMCEVIKYRGPDDEGFFVDDKIAIGMNRLSIIDLETGHQPIHNEDESIWIVFNGEIYNYRELKKNLEKKGHRFYTNSDTEAIVHLYEEFQEDCLKSLNGMFAFCIWDSNNGRIFLARDRAGQKPLHYYFDGKKFIFGSEIKSILQDETIKRELNYQAMQDFFTFEFIPSPKTIFKNIKKLPPGNSLIFEKGSIRIDKYWDLSFSISEEPETYYLLTLQKILGDSVEKRLVSDVPLGAFLSGGIDSSSVVAFMCEALDEPIKTFSIGFEDESYNELVFARKVADLFHTDHHEKVVKPDVVNLVEKILFHLDEPFADTSVFPTFIISELARRYVKVILSGDGGDELFAGYDRYIASRIERNYYARIPSFIRKTLFEPLAKSFPPSSQKKGLKNMYKRFVEGSMLSPEGRHLRWQTFLGDEEKKELFKERLMAKLNNYHSYQIVEEFYQGCNSRQTLGKESYVDIKLYLPEDILVKVDRMSMANSLEARSPFLDHRLMTFAASVPSQLKLKRFTTKYLLKKGMKDKLPSEILNREKQGFSIPMKNWLRDELQDVMLELLSKKRIKDKNYFNYHYVEKLIKQHLERRRDNSHKIWMLMVFEKWHDLYLMN